ncbi:type 1 fimbrial protein [Pseudomonas vlassakiae]|uniref:fimbrial protein n=1 Tax=Pseudomonas TaxID=286 RepID=UPI0021C8E9AA|nr:MULTISPECIES: fimbrial protein [Pseudomonas]MCU0126175.1 type 1 fimbrial protein [Pseudomonas vlassakiae]
MKAIKPALATLLLLAAVHGPQARASDDFPNFCLWDGPAGMFNYERNMNTIYVPRDALPGRHLHSDSGRPQLVTPGHTSTVECQNNGTAHYTATFSTLQPVVYLPNIEGPVLHTNIPGIGAQIEIGAPFIGPGEQNFVPDGPPLVPFTAHHTRRMGLLNFRWRGMYHRVTLIKIGDIAPGVHRLDTPLFNIHLNHPDIGHAGIYFLKGHVFNTQCSLANNAVSANPVRLKEWGTSHFTAEHTTTSPEAFQIKLSACQTDPQNSTFATIELHGANGSQPVGPDRPGVFSLSADSEAEGVGIRLMHEGKPVELGREVDLVPINDGTTTLNFSAQFYQTAPQHQVRAGLAKGALNFIIRYR